MRNGRKTRLAAMMIAAAVITMASMASAAPRRMGVDDPGAGRIPAGKARYELQAGKRASSDAAKRVFADAARLSLLRIRLHR